MADDVLYIISTVSAPEVTHPPHWHHHPDNAHEKRQTTQFNNHEDEESDSDSDSDSDRGDDDDDDGYMLHVH